MKAPNYRFHMMKIAVSLGLSLALAPSLVAGGGSDTVPKGKVIHTSLEKIRASPAAYKNVWVSFPLQFASVGQIQNPFFTQFVPSAYTNFYGWTDEQTIWRREQYEDLFGLLFISKENKQAEDLYGLKVFDRLVVTGIRAQHVSEPALD